MENLKVPSVPCPIHPIECIQRVNIDINASQLLYCMECVLQQRDPNFDTSTLKSINDLIGIADDFYQLNKDKGKISEGVPSDYAESLSKNKRKEPHISLIFLLRISPELLKTRRMNIWPTLTSSYSIFVIGTSSLINRSRRHILFQKISNFYSLQRKT
jgi:hypothetical protein